MIAFEWEKIFYDGNKEGKMEDPKNKIEELEDKIEKLENDIANIKEREGMSIFHMKRWMKLVGEHSDGSEAGLSDAFLKELFSTIHKYSVELQTSLIKKTK